MSNQSSLHHAPHHDGAYQKPAPYWKRAHRSWIFWVGVVLTFVAILIYVMSFDLIWRPRVRTAPLAPSATIGK